jgi:hypothetical protein
MRLSGSLDRVSFFMVFALRASCWQWQAVCDQTRSSLQWIGKTATLAREEC